MKMRFFTINIGLLLVLTCTGEACFAQTRDTIIIYDTIRISVPRSTQQSTNFFEQPTATISNDSIIIDEQRKETSTMSNLRTSANRLIRNVAVGTMATFSSISNVAQASTVSEISESQPYVDTVVRQIVEIDTVSTPKKESPIYLSFAFPAGIHGVNSENYVYNFALSALTGAVGGINGVQVGGIYNQVNGNVRGVQVGGIMNLTETVEGIQVAGICNFTQNVRGIQIAGIFNHSGDIKGIQVTGIANASNKVEGIQVTGIYNAADNVTGIQVSGIANEAKAVEGMQITGIYNQAERVRGIQVGLYNRTGTLHGVQIGLVNKVDTIEKGVSLGLFNYLGHDRFREFEISTNTYNTTFLNYRLGGHIFHGLLGIGTSWQQGHLELRWGFGNMTQLTGSLYLQSSLYWVNSSYYVRNMWLQTQNSWTTLSSGLVYYWGDKIGIKVIPNLNMWSHWHNRYSIFVPEPRFTRHRFSWGASLEVGLSIKF